MINPFMKPRHYAEELIDAPLVNVFRQTSQQPVTNGLNNEAHDECDEDEGNGLVPNLGPQVDAWTNPARDGLVVTQTSEQAQHPTGEVKHTMNKPAPIAIEHAQQNHDREQNVDGVNCHVESKDTDSDY